MGDEHERGRHPPHEVLEPLDGGEVEVVGGFVDEQQVGVLHEQLRKLEAALLAAAQLRGVAPLRLGVETEPAEGLSSGCLELVSTLVDVSMLDVPIAEQQLVGVGTGAVRKQRLQRGHLLMHRGEVLAGRHHLVEDGLRDRFGGILREVANAQAALPFHLALGWLECSVDERQQRCLARAVGADDRNALACLDAERDTFEDALGTEGDTHVAKTDQGQAAIAPWHPRGRRCAARWRPTTRTSSPCRNRRGRARQASEPACRGCRMRNG